MKNDGNRKIVFADMKGARALVPDPCLYFGHGCNIFICTTKVGL